MKYLKLIFILFTLSLPLLAAPRGPTGSTRWPVVFVPYLNVGGGYTTLLGNTLETAEASANLAVLYLKNHWVAGAQGEYSYFIAANRAKSESESFSGMEGTILLGVYFNDGSKILGGWTPYSEIKSSASMDKYRGSGLRGQIHWMISYPLQIILGVKQNSYTTKIDKDGTSTELKGDSQIKNMLVSLGVGYEF